jgi:fructose-bisphosphate aldolase class II
MPIATPEAYHHMLDHAKSQGFAFPAVNCVGSEAINAALKGFADAGSDGIIQISTGGAEFASGLGIKDMVTGAVALAEFTQVVAARYPITVALHTDHCPKDKLDTYVRPLLEISSSASTQDVIRCSTHTCGTARRSQSMTTSTSPSVCCTTPPQPM